MHCVVCIVLGKCMVVPGLSTRVYRCWRNDGNRQRNGDEQPHEDVVVPHVRALWAAMIGPSIEDAITLLVDDLAGLHQREVGGLIL